MKRWMAVLAALGFAASAGAAAAQASAPPKAATPPPMIRDLSPPTAQVLGTAIYSQDRQAWFAADLLTEAKLDLAPIIGWINVPFGEGSRVRFLKRGPTQPLALYDVVFDGSTRPVVQAAKDPALTPGELTQWRALNTALGQKHLFCSERSPNHVELQLPASGEWLVWILTPWETPKALPFGGHTRFNISPDGRQIIRAEELARSCLAMDPTPPAGAKGAAMVVTQLVANTPVETLVFNALQAKTTIMVTTPDKAIWQVDGKAITRVGSVAAPVAAPPRTAPPKTLPQSVAQPKAAPSVPPRSGSSAARPSGSSPPSASPPVRLRGSVSNR